MSYSEEILAVNSLTICYRSTPIVRDINFSLNRGQTVALVGESGSGKSLTAQAIIRLFCSDEIKIAKGEILLDTTNLLHLTERDMHKLRGSRIAFISQNPLSSLNPTLSIGYQLMESISSVEPLSKNERKERSINILHEVGIPDTEKRFHSYPHELSGGMRQRVLIAQALINEPDIVIADEPTTALDVTIQAQIIDLLKTIQKKRKMALLFITHDLGVVAQIADQVIVMYAGRIVETASVNDLFANPQHPYTQGLLKAIPLWNTNKPLIPIPGSPPLCGQSIGSCAFKPRCEHAMEICLKNEPPLIQIGANQVRCFKAYADHIHKQHEVADAALTL